MTQRSLETTAIKKKTAEPHRLLWADSLRGLACLIVMLAHIIAADPAYGMYANGCGKIGVWLFMLLSGFLFGRSSFFQEQQLSIRNVLRFYEKKALRILPEYLIALLFAVAIGLFDIHKVKDILLFRATWGHFWYMPVIIKFYLIAPIFVALRRAIERGKAGDRGEIGKATLNQRRYLYCALLMIIAVSMSIIFPFTRYLENSIELKWYLPVYIMGILLAEVTGMFTMKEKSWYDILSLVGFIIILILTPFGRQTLFGYAPSGYLQNKYLIMSVLWIFVMLGAMLGRFTNRLLKRSTFLQVIAIYSYSLYLYHYTILQWICGRYGNMPNWMRGILTIIGSVLIAVILRKASGIIKHFVHEYV